MFLISPRPDNCHLTNLIYRLALRRHYLLVHVEVYPILVPKPVGSPESSPTCMPCNPLAPAGIRYVGDCDFTMRPQLRTVHEIILVLIAAISYSLLQCIVCVVLVSCIHGIVVRELQLRVRSQKIQDERISRNSAEQT